MEGDRLWPDGPVFRQDRQQKLTTDSLLLADFARIKAGEKGADLGCASGLLMLLLLWREPGLHMTGLELRPEAAGLAEENLRANGLTDCAEILCGDFRETVKQLQNAGFDFVIANPPYFPTDSGTLPGDRDRAAARGETECSLPELLHTAARLCRSGGKLFLCFRPERLGELMEEMRKAHLEPKRLRFVHHRAAAAASIVLVEGRKDGRPGTVVEAPVFLTGEDGRETEEYRRICHR